MLYNTPSSFLIIRNFILFKRKCALIILTYVPSYIFHSICSEVVLPDILSLGVFKKARSLFEPKKHLDLVFSSVRSYLHTGESTPKHHFETLAKVLESGESWRTCHVMCRGIKVEDLVMHIKSSPSCIPHEATLNIKVLKAENFARFDILLNSLRVGTDEFAYPLQWTKFISWRRTVFDYHFAGKNAKEIIMILVDASDDGLRLIERLPTYCSGYAIKIDKV